MDNPVDNSDEREKHKKLVSLIREYAPYAPGELRLASKAADAIEELLEELACEEMAWWDLLSERDELADQLEERDERIERFETALRDFQADLLLAEHDIGKLLEARR